MIGFSKKVAHKEQSGINKMTLFCTQIYNEINNMESIYFIEGMTFQNERNVIKFPIFPIKHS